MPQTPPAVTDTDLREIAQIKPDADDRPLPARKGTLGVCSKCKRSVISHFDTVGQFAGCTEGEDGDVFVLTAVPAGLEAAARRQARVRPERRRVTKGATPPAPVAKHPPAKRKQTTATPALRARRGRYVSTVPARKLPKLDLPAGKLKVLRPIAQATDDGLLAREIEEQTGMTHGAVQQALIWLRQHEPPLIAVTAEPTKTR